MHAVPEKTGAALLQRLGAAVEAAGMPVVTRRAVTGLFVDGQRVLGAEVTRPDGRIERIGCKALVLACSGYAGNPGPGGAAHPGDRLGALLRPCGQPGDALLWGQALGAATRDLSGYQGHGSLAHPQAS